MGKQLIFGIIFLGIGVAGGFGIAYMRYQAATTDFQTEIDDLKAEAQKAKDTSEETLKNAGRQIADAKAQLKNSQDIAIRLGKENRTYKLENQRLKTQLAQAGGRTGSPTASTPASASSVRAASRPTTLTRPTVSRPTTTRPVTTSPRPAATTTAREYTIQEGDSLWKIAENELDNGMRYKEIIELNPPLTENSKLVIGKKLKLPAK